MQTSLRNLNLQELEALAAQCGEAPYRGRQVAEWLFKRGAVSFDQLTNIPKGFLEKIKENYRVNSLELEKEEISERDGSAKFLFKTAEGNFIETVLIVQGDRRTVCVSTQVGCKMGCGFCASGKAGFVANLNAGAILDQVAWIYAAQKAWPTNIVYMGMGEPLDNYEAVMRSIRALNADWGYQIGQRRISVSTVGLIPGIEKLATEEFSQIKLCFSLHSPDEKIRSQLIPVNKKYTLAEIVNTLEAVREKFKRPMTMEYILIQELTDRPRDAEAVAVIAHRLNAKVNLIPYNAIDNVEFVRPGEERIRRFQDLLESRNVRTTIRYSAGPDINAACGQLRLSEMNKRDKKSLI